MPLVEVHIVPSTAAPSGIGEPGVPPLAPAVANAIAAATILAEMTAVKNGLRTQDGVAEGKALAAAGCDVG